MWLHCKLLSVVLLLSLGGSSSAALVVTIGPALTTINKPLPGNTTNVTMTVFLNANSGTESVLGYTLPLDLSPPVGTEPPVGMTIPSAGVTLRTNFAGQPPLIQNNPGEGDLVVIAGANNVQPIIFDATPTALFDFNISIDSSVAERDYQIDVVRGVLLSLDRNLTSTAIFSPPAIIRVTAVPEPTFLGLLGGVAIPVLMRRVRRS